MFKILGLIVIKCEKENDNHYQGNCNDYKKGLLKEQPFCYFIDESLSNNQ